MSNRHSGESRNPVTSIREGTLFTRTTAAVVITTFLSLILSPTAAAAREVIEDPTKLTGKLAAPANKPDRLNPALKQLKGVLKRMEAGAAKGAVAADDLQSLATIRTELDAANQEVLAGFDVDLEHIRKHKLPQVIVKRHAKALGEYKAKHAQMLAHLDAVSAPGDATARKANLTKARKWLEAQQLDPTPALFDPNKLGFMVETEKARAPKLTEKELKAVLPAPAEAPLNTSALSDAAFRHPGESRDPVPTASAIDSPRHPRPSTALRTGSSGDPAPFLLPLPLGEVGAHRAPGEGVFTDPPEPIYVASAGAMSGLLAISAVTPPGPEFLAPTIDVQITEDIQALAAQLNHSPVEIYNWARNTLDWIPTYGSVQGSQLTLDKKAGNAFDISSLLIALLRASNIPARYAYGTIQVPIDEAMNWAGGFTSPDALQTFLATGGIPNNALTSGGVTKFIRMEHIWVEAFVDFEPSRGARNLTPDSWVPMDASFKQYAYTEGLDMEGQVPFDAEDLLTSAQEGATVNEDEGWVQNLNQANIRSQLSKFEEELQDKVDSLAPDTSVRDILGGHSVRVASAPVLAASLPYQLIAQGSRYVDLPDGLRHKFRYSLYQDSHHRAIDNPLWTYEVAAPSLAGRKVTLSFVPASLDDRNALASYIPEERPDGSAVDPSEFPTSLPAYSIRVAAHLTLDGQVLAQGGSFPLGTPIIGEGGFTQYHNPAIWDLTLDRHLAGQTTAIGISLQGLPEAQLSSLVAKLQEEQVGIESGLELRSENISADVLMAGMWSYLASVESQAAVANRQTSVESVSGLSYGFLHAQLKPISQYGVTTRVSFPGLQMDVGHLRRVAYARDGNSDAWVSQNYQRGLHSSAKEHGVAEALYNANQISDPVKGVSAVRLLSVASLNGQRIYTIDKSNEGQLGDIHQSASVTENIRAAINAGKQVVVHQDPVAFSGFTGAGYIVRDPSTGAGSYLIEGASNGGEVSSPAWSFVKSGLAGLVDALVAFDKINSIDDAYPYKEPSMGGVGVKAIAGGLAVLGLAAAIIGTLANDDLSTGDKVARILADTAFAVLGFALGAALGPGLVTLPLLQVLLFTVVLVLVLQFLQYLILESIAVWRRAGRVA